MRKNCLEGNAWRNLWQVQKWSLFASNKAEELPEQLFHYFKFNISITDQPLCPYLHPPYPHKWH